MAVSADVKLGWSIAMVRAARAGDLLELKGAADDDGCVPLFNQGPEEDTGRLVHSTAPLYSLAMVICTHQDGWAYVVVGDRIGWVTPVCVRNRYAGGFT